MPRRPLPLLLALALAAPAVAALPAPAPASAQVLPAPPKAPLGHDRIGVRRGGTWLLSSALDGTGARAYSEGTSGWQPVAGDFDGDGNASVSLFKDGVWKLRDTEGGPVTTLRFGLRGDQPLVGDFDGDGVDTLAVFRNGRWFLRTTNSSLDTRNRTFAYGLKGDVAVVGDWDGDGDDDIGVRRGITWYQRDAASSGPTSRTFRFGNSGDLPVAGDWDHDGRDTPGLFRSGRWFFARGSGFGGYQTASFGRAGDRPVVRRTQGLAPGATHRVVRGPGPTLAHVVEVDLAAASSVDAVLSGGDLRGLETTSSMGRRSGAAVAVNGDYFLGNGRPVHVMAADGRLLQTPQLLGRAVGLDLSGTQVRMGFPDVRVELQASDTPTTVTRWNGGPPSGDGLAGFTGIGAGIETPPDGACYVGANTSAPRVRPDGGVESRLDVTGTRCGGTQPYVGPTMTVLAANRGTGGESFVRSVRAGTSIPMTAHLGFPGAVDVVGGNPLLLQDGVRQSQDHSGRGAFFARQPRTAVGVTADGRLLLVVVDGRQSGYSVGMTLGELADLMSRLGARDAINLDGGGSSTMFLNGLVANRPSDSYRERGVANALVVLPGADPGESGVQLAAGSRRTSSLRAGEPAAPPVPVTLPLPVAPQLVDAATSYGAAVRDAGSVGGLLDSGLSEPVR